MDRRPAASFLMVAGHLALGLAASGRRPSLPLAACLVAALAPDLAMGALGLVAPPMADAYSHSVLAILLWMATAAVLAAAIRRSWQDAAVLAALVASHLPADWVTSRLTLWPGGPRWGVGLYANPGVDFALEGALSLAGWAVYRGGLPVAARERALAWAPLGVLLALQASWAWLSSR